MDIWPHRSRPHRTMMSTTSAIASVIHSNQAETQGRYLKIPCRLGFLYWGYPESLDLLLRPIIDRTRCWDAMSYVRQSDQHTATERHFSLTLSTLPMLLRKARVLRVPCFKAA